MHVGQQHRVDLLGPVAGGLQVVLDAAQRRTEAGGGTGIDQHQLLPGMDQEGIDRGLHARRGLQEHACQQRLDLVGGQPLEQPRRQRHDAIEQRGDLEVAEGGAVVARDLAALLRGRRRLRLGQRSQRRAQRGQRQQRGGQGAAQRESRRLRRRLRHDRHRDLSWVGRNIDVDSVGGPACARRSESCAKRSAGPVLRPPAARAAARPDRCARARRRSARRSGARSSTPSGSRPAAPPS